MMGKVRVQTWVLQQYRQQRGGKNVDISVPAWIKLNIKSAQRTTGVRGCIGGSGASPPPAC